MALYHRKLLSEQDPDQTVVCSNCRPTCTYNCDYVSIYWPPEHHIPPSSTANNDSVTVNISPYLIVTVSLIVSAVLFATYYFLIIRYCTRFRQVSATQADEQSRDFIDEDQAQEFDHPIWYITSVGLQPAVINSITVVKFKKGDSLTDGTDCTVCLGEFKDDECLRILPKCNHAFHVSCIDTWLRSHTNCPVCRASVVSNISNGAVSQLSDQDRNQRFDLNQNTPVENVENHGEMHSDHESRTEIQDLKPEIRSLTALRRAFSMNSAQELVPMDSKSSGSTINLHSLNHMTDSRTRRMTMMVRSF